MASHVICISHADGAGGEGIGRAVADKLSLRYVNEEIILEASRLAHVDPALVAATEQKQSFLTRILDSLAAAQEAIGPAALAGFAVATAPEIGMLRADPDDLRSLIRAAIHEVCRNGNAVIVAHAASFALAGKPGVLRVMVTASERSRGQRVAAERKLSADDAETAISKGDRARREYLRKFYDVNEELPTHYDLVVNTDLLSATQATAIIVAAASSTRSRAEI